MKALSTTPSPTLRRWALQASRQLLIVAKKDFPANNLAELIAYVKANPDTINQANAGVGSTSFTTCVLLRSIAESRK